MSSFSVYMISNDTNNKVYIGQTTKSIYERFNEHCICGTSEIGKSIQSIGKEHFAVSLLDDTASNLDELAKLEEFYIQKYNSIENGYNSRPACKSKGMALEPKPRTNLTIQKTLKAKLEEIAKKENRSFNNLVITVLQKFVEDTAK